VAICGQWKWREGARGAAKLIMVCFVCSTKKLKAISQLNFTCIKSYLNKQGFKNNKLLLAQN
jgi:hypothetical protein